MPTTFNVISLGVLPSIDPTEGNQDAENANALVGMTFGGPGDALVNDFKSLSPGSTGFTADDTDAYDNDDAGDTFSIDGGPDQVFDARSIYNATITYTDGTTATVTIMVFQDTLGNTYAAPEASANTDQSELEAKPIRSMKLDSLNDNDGDMSASRQTWDYAVCYAPGTLIETPDGPREIETLTSGDLVNTLDHGPQQILWVRKAEQRLEDVAQDAKPVQIAAGTFGRGRPFQDLIVSPQHRVLVGGGGQLDHWFPAEALAPAKSLSAIKGVRHRGGKRVITWIHLACARHEILTANGCLSESLLLGPMVVNALTDCERRELTALYGFATTNDAALNGPPARPCLRVSDGRRRIESRMKEMKRHDEKETDDWNRSFAMA